MSLRKGWLRVARQMTIASGVGIVAGVLTAGVVSPIVNAAVPSSGMIATFAGSGTSGFSGDGGSALSARLSGPVGVAIDSSGSLYIADRNNERVRRVAPDGAISTVAGTGTSGFSGDGGPATAAQLSFPVSVAVDASDNLYIVEGKNFRVRKVTRDGTITTVAGNGSNGFSGDGGPATSASLSDPTSVAVDTSGNLYIADPGNERIRVVSPDGIISTFAGNGTSGFSGDGGPATSAQLNYPAGVAADHAGNLYIADGANNRIRKVAANRSISTVAGSGGSGVTGDGGPATQATLRFPTNVEVDSRGNIYVAGGELGSASVNNRTVRRVSPDGIIATVAGNSTFGYSGDGGPATEASLTVPADVAVDGSGNLYIADQYNNRVRVVGAVVGSDSPTPPSSGSPTMSVGIGGAPTKTGDGVWVGYTNGDVHSVGAAADHGDLNGSPLNAPVVGIASTASGGGYWLLARDGGVFSYGDAAFHGSTGDLVLNQPIVSLAGDRRGRGYWFVAADGGVFSFGAPFLGSAGNLSLSQPIVGMATTTTGNGYWLVARDGGIFSFGDARFSGSTGSITLNQPIVGMAADPDGHGYWMVAADGGIFSFDATFHGSGVGSVANGDQVVGIVAHPSGGYWLITAAGGVMAYGAAGGVAREPT